MDWQFSSVKVMKGSCCFIVLSIMALSDASSKKISIKETFSRSNKIPLKSIKSPGDIIDCIHIYHQPAFDHPLLKNHTILNRPSYHPGKGLLSENDIFNFDAHSHDDTITQLWQLNGRCPEGTIPIRRHQNTRNVKRYAKQKHQSAAQLPSVDFKLATNSNLERAFAYVQSGKYFGAKAKINVWKPQVQNHEFSSSQIAILGCPNSNLNAIEAGWMVLPDLYGDDRPRLFTYWTKDGYQSTGCYNLLCSGFVQTSKKLSLGATIFRISTYHGPQFDITLYIWKDPKKDVWWLQYGNDTLLGYWPASIFTDLADSASVIGWGGEVVNSALNGEHTTTQMGSGYFPEEKFGGSSFFKNLQVVDESNNLGPTGELNITVDKPNCYNIILGKQDDGWGDFFYYGGPGKNDKCP